MVHSIKKHLPSIAVVMLSTAFFLIKFTGIVLDPTQIAWLLNGNMDMRTEFVAWEYFRQTEWSFPIFGLLKDYEHPTVMGVGMTGAVPLLALPIKLFSSILPPVFQYFGWWFWFCFVAQGLLAYRLLRGCLPNDLSYIGLAVIGTVFFISAPIMLWREGHIPLFAHGIILASL